MTSAGALIDGFGVLGAKWIAVVAPYMKPVTQSVVDCIEAEGVSVTDRVSLEIEVNVEVGRRDPGTLVDVAKQMDLTGIDALVLSACVQMP